MAMKDRTSLPAVDDHFIVEGSRVEVVKGKLLMVPPADEPHAAAHGNLGYVLRAHVSAAYVVALDMLTRTSVDSDFAPDASVYPAARDPKTGRRLLEELAFEIAWAQPLQAAGDKARELARRGVRRVFCIGLKHGRVLEWSHDTDAWSPLPDTASIEDRCFVRPIPVRVLIDATNADAAVTRALIARGNPVLAELAATAVAEGEARGEARGQALATANAIQVILQQRDLQPTAAEIAVIKAATPDSLAKWLQRAFSVQTVAALFED